MERSRPTGRILPIKRYRLSGGSLVVSMRRAEAATALTELVIRSILGVSARLKRLSY
jgi:hypothetical protein